MKKQRAKIGALFAIDLGENKYAFGRDLNFGESIFYNYIASALNNEEIKKAYASPIAFRTSVMRYAITSGRWPIIDKSRSLEPEYLNSKDYFIQDNLTKKLSIYSSADGNTREATREECEKLECAAVWEPEHIEDRLRDHFSGAPNKWLLQLALK